MHDSTASAQNISHPNSYLFPFFTSSPSCNLEKSPVQYALEHNGQLYQAFFPAETEENEDDPDNGLVILKVIHEDGEDLLSTLDSDEELETVYELFMENLFQEDGD